MTGVRPSRADLVLGPRQAPVRGRLQLRVNPRLEASAEGSFVYGRHPADSFAADSGGTFPHGGYLSTVRGASYRQGMATERRSTLDELRRYPTI